MTKLINIMLTTLLSGFVGLVTSMFFLGSDETYQNLRTTLLSSFTQRALGGITIALLGSGTLVLLNYLVFKVRKINRPIDLREIFWWTVLSANCASILGTVIFFSHKTL